MYTGLAATLMSIAMLAAFALAAGGLWLALKAGERKKGGLMLLMAAILVGNVAIWSV